MVNDTVAEKTPPYCINIVTVEGFLANDVNIIYNKAKNVYKALFCLKNPFKNGEKVCFNRFNVVVYGKKAKDCKHFLKKGDYCTVTGKIFLLPKEDENNVEGCFATINASDVFWNKNKNC